jgi:hypothetical protein
MHQQLWGYKVEEKLYLGVREQKTLNTTDLDRTRAVLCLMVLAVLNLWFLPLETCFGCSMCGLFFINV